MEERTRIPDEGIDREQLLEMVDRCGDAIRSVLDEFDDISNWRDVWSRLRGRNDASDG